MRTSTINSKQVLKFLLSGGLAAATEYAVFTALRIVGSMLLVSQSLSFVAGLLVSFTLNKKWVFGSKGEIRRELGWYMLLACVNLFLSNVLIYLLVSGVNLNEWFAKVATMFFVAVWNFFVYKLLIFR